VSELGAATQHRSGWETFPYSYTTAARWHLIGNKPLSARLVLHVGEREYEVAIFDVHPGAELLLDHIEIHGHRYRRAVE
jgi:hypothetical protein